MNKDADVTGLGGCQSYGCSRLWLGRIGRLAPFEAFFYLSSFGCFDLNLKDHLAQFQKLLASILGKRLKG